MTDRDSAAHRVILRTDKSREVDIVASALEKNGLSFIRHKRSKHWIILALPISFTPGPLEWWALLVPESEYENARIVLSAAGFDSDTPPDMWDYGITDAKAKKWVVLTFLILFVVGALTFAYLAKAFRHVH